MSTESPQELDGEFCRIAFCFLLGSQWTFLTAPQVRTYRVMRVNPTDDGRQKIEAVLMPTNDSGRLLLSLDWDEPSAWVIRG